MDAKQERAQVVKYILRSGCKNYLYEYLLQRKEQASFTKDIQLKYDGYLVKLFNFKNDCKLRKNAKIALDAFEEHLLVALMMIFWFRLYPARASSGCSYGKKDSRCEKLKEEETAIQTASLGHLNICRKTLTHYAYAQKVLTEGVKLQTPQKRENETEGIELSSKK
ncbi:4129_t:CDS:2, partial [Funneliformis caledonium]